MEISKLEIKGFKSFGDRIKIHFDHRVTGIVGPNGSGKSNVVDAIRWVLGEQKTRVLRSDKMENVIFNGTKIRKPAQIAEVSLTFDNNQKLLPPEYTRVTITRRYSRSGDSQYFINEVPSRLKDINNLFLDTGIGSDSYAIIELKMVDEILNDKDSARRSLLEKAAGISKFKLRKREAMRRLEAVDLDLSRVEDLLSEIQKNLNSLEKQAKQAERYLELKAEYRKTSIIYAKRSVSRQNTTLEALERQLTSETEKREILVEHLNQREANIEKEKEDAVQFETDFYDRQKDLNTHQGELRNSENEKKLSSERLRFLRDKNDTLTVQIRQDEQNKNEIEKSLTELEIKRKEAQTELDEISNDLADLQEAYETQKSITAEIQQKANSLTQQNSQKQELVYQIKKDYEVKQSQQENLVQELANLTSQSDNQQSQLDSFEGDLQEAQESLDFAQSHLESLQTEEENNQQARRFLEQEIDEIRENLRQKNRLRDARQNELELTQSLVTNLEGFPEATRYLSQNQSEWTENNCPLVSEVFQYPAEFGQAMQAFLEPYSNYFVATTFQEAYAGIQFLQNAKNGKANFFVLETIQNQAKETTQIPQATTLLSILAFDSQFQSLANLLFREVYVIDNWTQELSNQHPNAIFLQKDGTLIRRKSILSGGSVEKETISHGERVQRLKVLPQEIESLQTEITAIENTFSEKTSELQALREQNLKQEISAAQLSYNQANEEVVSLRTKQEQINQLLNNQNQRREQLQNRQSELETRLAELLPQAEQEESQMKEIQSQIKDLDEQFALENEALTMKSSRYNQQNILFYQQKGKVENIEQEITYKQQSQANLEKRIAQAGTEQKQAKEDVERLAKNFAEQEKEVYQLQQKTATFQKNLEEAEKTYYSIRGQIGESEKEFKEMQRQKELLDSLLQELNNKKHETKLSLTSMRERLAAEFQLDLDDLINADSEGEEEEMAHLNEQQLKSKTEDLKKRIQRIGTVNPMAMETYQEMKDRFDFIDKQKNDLMESKKALLKTIREMENYAKKAFLKSFEAVRQNFIKVFRSLFMEEDDADLVLLDPESPLESDIDIIAKPKGKRPLTINQLSGGEKTLTATSLLFALYLLKPAPFCIFDEVDAPLDDVNTEKFNNIIRNFSKESQFIIVTHNKRTMANMEAMYGVTMQEGEGVSMIVPASLKEVEKL